MKILLWLSLPLAVTLLAMLWATWFGRPRRENPDDEQVTARFGAAIVKPLPRRATHVVRQVADRPTGVAVRRSTKPGPPSP